MVYQDGSRWSGEQVRWIADQNYDIGWTAGYCKTKRKYLLRFVLGVITGTAITLILLGG